MCGGRRRARILFALIEGPLDVSALALVLGLLGSSISHSLRPLRDTGLVGRRRVKKRCLYALGAAITVVRSGNRIGLELSATDESSVVLWEVEPVREAKAGLRRGASVRARKGNAR